MNKKIKYIINGACIAVIGVGLIIGNKVIENFEAEINTFLNPAIVDKSKVSVSADNGQ